MIVSRRYALAALTLLGSLGYAAPGDARGLLAPADQNRLVSQLENRPMVFFVAKGAAGSCGPGCGEWIAAEGMIAPGTAQRFRDFLATLTRRDLPIFFHSRGGFGTDAAQIGLILRARRMTAGVGRTMTERCRVFSRDDAACQRLIKSGGEVKARLLVNEGRCFSACVYAFAGGSTRRLASGSMLGVHSARIDATLTKLSMPDAPDARKTTVADLHGVVQRYLVQMGIEPRLEDISVKVSPRRIYILSQDEITHFGIETRGSFETSWLAYVDSSKRPLVQKSVTRAMGADGNEYLTSGVRLLCFNGAIWFLYQRELPANEVGVATVAHVAAGDDLLVLRRREMKDAGELQVALAADGFLRNMMAAPSIVITEASVQNGLREVKLSTNGLSRPLEQLLKDCGELKLLSGAGVDGRQ